MTLVNSVNPDRIEGQKTAAFEVCDALGGAAGRALPSGRQRRQHHRVLARLRRASRRSRPRQLAAAHARLPGRRRSADRARRAGGLALDHRDGHPHRQPRLVAVGARRARRVRRRDPGRQRPRDPGGVQAARHPRGRLRRAVQRRERRRLPERPSRRPGRPGRAGGLHRHRPRAQGPGLGDQPAPPSRPRCRRTLRSPRPSWVWPSRWRQRCSAPAQVTGAGAGDQRQPRSRLRRARSCPRHVRRARRCASPASRACGSRPTATCPTDETNLVVRGARAAFAAVGEQPPGLELGYTARIPHSRGLGSSAAAICAGVTGALALRGVRDRALALRIARSHRGPSGQRRGCAVRRAHHRLARRGRQRRAPSGSSRLPASCRSRSSRRRARRPRRRAARLPTTVSHADAARNAGRAALLVAALTAAPGSCWLPPRTACTSRTGCRRYRKAAALIARAAGRRRARRAVRAPVPPSLLCVGTAPSQPLLTD